MEKLYSDDPTDPANHPFLLLLIFVVIVISCLLYGGCVSIDKTGFRAGIIDSNDYNDNGVEIHQRSCTGLSILW